MLDHALRRSLLVAARERAEQQRADKLCLLLFADTPCLALRTCLRPAAHAPRRTGGTSCLLGQGDGLLCPALVCTAAYAAPDTGAEPGCSVFPCLCLVIAVYGGAAVVRGQRRGLCEASGAAPAACVQATPP